MLLLPLFPGTSRRNYKIQISSNSVSYDSMLHFAFTEITVGTAIIGIEWGVY